MCYVGFCEECNPYHADRDNIAYRLNLPHISNYPASDHMPLTFTITNSLSFFQYKIEISCPFLTSGAGFSNGLWTIGREK
jgi:hypothetical protein